MKDSINPIIQLPPGVCRNCRSPLTIILSDMVKVRLNESGMPITEEVYRSSVKGICERCLTEHPMIRKGLFYVPDTDWGRNISCNDNYDSARVLRGTKKENPFSDKED